MMRLNGEVDFYGLKIALERVMALASPICDSECIGFEQALTYFNLRLNR